MRDTPLGTGSQLVEVAHRSAPHQCPVGNGGGEALVPHCISAATLPHPRRWFYEWQALTPKKKQPQYITLRSGQPFAFAGLWESWQLPGGSRVESCTILTTAANALMQQFHDRMPVILSPDEFAPWLDPKLIDPAALFPLLDQYPADEMTAFPVSTRVNSVKNDSPELVVPSV